MVQPFNIGGDGQGVDVDMEDREIRIALDRYWAAPGVNEPRS